MCTFSDETEAASARNSLVMQISGVMLAHICYDSLIDIYY